MAEIKNIRDEKQEEVSKLWLDSDRKSTLVLGTGFGKSKLAMLILDALFKEGNLTKNSSILLLADSEKLRDDNWKEDFEKWGYSWMWNNIQAECYQTAYKWVNTSWDLVIADEIDFAMTDEFHKVFVNNDFQMVLGLTGYVDPSKEDLINNIAPIIVKYSTQDAQKDGILNGTQVVFVEYDLSRNPKDITVEYTKGGKKQSFTQSENDAYAYYEDRCNILWGKITQLESDPDVVFGIDAEKMYDLRSLKYRWKKASSDRKNLLFNGIASKSVTKKLISEILKNPNNKVLTFSMYTDQADSINDVTFHGKNKKGNTALEDLSSGKIRSVGVCKAVNRGINLVGVNNLVVESYDGSKTSFHQRHGRGMRLNPNQKMYLYILLPYYRKKIQSPENKDQKVEVRRPTQMVKWATNMLDGFHLHNPMTIKL